MSTANRSSRAERGFAIAIAFAAGIVLASSGWLGGDRVAQARPQEPSPPKPTSAAIHKADSGGLNPAAQRAEMIRLLRSIDRRLESMAEKTK